MDDDVVHGDAGFLPSWPMYYVAFVEQTTHGTNQVIPKISPTGEVDEIVAIPVFTEELLAERYRNGSHPGASIQTIRDRYQFASLAGGCAMYNGATHYGIDPDQAGGDKARWLDFRNIPREWFHRPAN